MIARTAHQPRQTGAYPPLTLSVLTLAAIAGAVGTVAFDIWGQAISPMLGFGALSPDGLARALLGKLGLPNGAAQGNFMHLVVIGMLAYPIGYLAIFRPLQERVLPATGWLVASVVYGIGLWVVAIGGIAGFALGQPFLGFTTITWVALVGHVVYAIALAATLRWGEAG